MKVIKFGGSSLANATQLRKVFNIVKSDEKRKIVVVSAPGKRTSDDEKVTDLLIQLATSDFCSFKISKLALDSATARPLAIKKFLP